MKSVSRKLMASGALIAAVAHVRLGIRLQHAFSAQPEKSAQLFAGLGYSWPPRESELLVVGFQYAFVRRAYPGLEGTPVEAQRNMLALWCALFVAGAVIGFAGLVLSFVEP